MRIAVRATFKPLWLSAFLLIACPDSQADRDPIVATPPAPPELYERCGASVACVEGECIEFESPAGSTCAVECLSDEECPANPNGEVLCDHGHCRGYVCDAARHLRLLGNALICIRGDVVECASLTPRPCNCECEEGTRCEQQLCVPKLAIGASCTIDDACATDYCSRGQYGGKGVCKKPAGATCNPRAAMAECEAGCTAPAGGTSGYCLAQCDVYCGAVDCSHRCEDTDFTCGSDDVCRVTCGADEDCLDWEVCSFASIVAAKGVCRPGTTVDTSRPDGGTGTSDGGVTVRDAGTTVRDAGTVVRDAGTTIRDAGTVVVQDGGTGLLGGLGGLLGGGAL